MFDVTSEQGVARGGGWLAAVMVAVMSSAAAGESRQGGRDSGPTPRVFLADAQVLRDTREAVDAGNPALLTALGHLRNRADRALEEGPFSVTDKTEPPPSGDKRDYRSMGPYWWPNPATEDGLPYIRRDGQRNPESQSEMFDRTRRGQMTEAVQVLAVAWYFTGEPRYAEHGARLLRTWFLDEATAMNPHLEFGQAIPGRVEGRGIGIIDTVGFIDLIDAVGLLQSSDHWSDEDHRQLQQWFRQYLHWLKTSQHGIDEQATHNNHGTWYDAQVVVFALFVGEEGLARRQLRDYALNRLTQIDPTGVQPHEVARTLPWAYSIYNLRAFVVLARMAEHVGFDLWQYETADGRSIRAAFDYLLPFALDPDSWPYEDLRGVTPRHLSEVILPLGYARWRDPELLRIYHAIPGRHRATREVLLYHGPLLIEQ